MPDWSPSSGSSAVGTVVQPERRSVNQGAELAHGEHPTPAGSPQQRGFQFMGCPGGQMFA